MPIAIKAWNCSGQLAELEQIILVLYSYKKNHLRILIMTTNLVFHLFEQMNKKKKYVYTVLMDVEIYLNVVY